MIKNINNITNFKRFNNIIVRFKKYKHNSPKLKLDSVQMIYPPPGYNLVLPEWSTEEFFNKIGMGTVEYSSKFENIQNVFDTKTVI